MVDAERWRSRALENIKRLKRQRVACIERRF